MNLVWMLVEAFLYGLGMALSEETMKKIKKYLKRKKRGKKSKGQGSEL